MSLKKYIGTKEFYKKITIIAIPLALSELLQNCMSIIDTIMVSSIGMVTAVGNASNILSLHYMIGWGILSGTGSFAAQFYGANQKENLSKTFGLALILSSMLTLVTFTLVYGFGREILLFYLNDPKVVEYSLQYLKIVVWMFIPLSLTWPASMTYRAMGNTKMPFVFSLIVSGVNVCLNYLLIYVYKLGIQGAAIATLIAESVIAILYVVAMVKDKPMFLSKPSIMFKLDFNFIKIVFEKTLPVLLNESIFGFGLTLINKVFGMLGTEAMDAYYVALEVFNFFTFIIWGYGAAVSITIGQTLGKGKIQEAKEDSNYILGYSMVIGVIFTILVCVCAPMILKIFSFGNDNTYKSAILLLYVFGLKLLFRNINYTMFSILKSGGDTKVIGFYDAGIQYCVGLLFAFVAVKTGITSIVLVALIEQSEQIVRYFLVRKRINSGLWANDLTQLVL